jgi:hypothetical protein
MKDRVFVVAGGPSVRNFPFFKLANEDCIAVNKSIVDVPTAKYFVTIDFSLFKKVDRSIVSTSHASRFFIANFAKPYLKDKNGQIVDTRFPLIYDLSDFHVIIKSPKEEGIGFSFNDFRSGNNSGFCALQLAVLLGYKMIYLLGVDLAVTGSVTHYHGGYGEAKEKFEKKLPGYRENFEEGLRILSEERPDVKVVSCSQISRLNMVIKYVDVDEVLNRRTYA